jgi:hypothetical protein
MFVFLRLGNCEVAPLLVMVTMSRLKSVRLLYVTQLCIDESGDAYTDGETARVPKKGSAPYRTKQ